MPTDAPVDPYTAAVQEATRRYQEAAANRDALVGAFHANRASALVQQTGMDPVSAVQISQQLYAPHFRALADAVPPPQPIVDHHAAVAHLMTVGAPAATPQLRMGDYRPDGKQNWSDSSMALGMRPDPNYDPADMRDILQPNHQYPAITEYATKDEQIALHARHPGEHGKYIINPSEWGTDGGAIKDFAEYPDAPDDPHAWTTPPKTLPTAPNYTLTDEDLKPENVIDERGGNDLPEGLWYPTANSGNPYRPSDKTPYHAFTKSGLPDKEHPLHPMMPNGNATAADPLDIGYRGTNPYDEVMRSLRAAGIPVDET